MRATGVSRAPTPADSAGLNSTHGGTLMGANAFNSHSQNLHRRGLSATVSQPTVGPTHSGGMARSRSMQNCGSPSSQGDTQGGAAGCFRDGRRTSFEQASASHVVCCNLS